MMAELIRHHVRRRRAESRRLAAIALRAMACLFVAGIVFSPALAVMVDGPLISGETAAWGFLALGAVALLAVLFWPDRLVRLFETDEEPRS